MTPEAFATAIREGGAVVVLALGIFFIAVGAVRGWWVPGYLYREALERSDRLEEKLDKVIPLLGRSVDVTEAVVSERKRR